MTIITGLIGKDAIFLASDSQTTYGNGGSKTLNAKKLSVVEFQNQTALVAEAGAADPSGRAVELFQRAAKEKTVENSETIIGLAREIVRSIRNEQIEMNNLSEDGRRRFFKEEFAFNLMIGYYFANEPYLYTIDIDWCLPHRVTSHCAEIGIGDTVARHILNEISEPGMHFKEALATSIYVIEKVKQSVDSCGGPAQAGYVYSIPDDHSNGVSRAFHRKGIALPYSQAVLVPPKEINRFVSRVAQFDLQTKEHRNGKLLELLKSADQEFMQECADDFLKQITRPPEK